MGNEPIAKEYLMLTNSWYEADSETIAENVERYIIEKYPDCKVRSTMYKKLARLTGLSVHTVYAWMNKSRNKIKIPLDKLCFIAMSLQIDVEQFLLEEKV